MCLTRELHLMAQKAQYPLIRECSLNRNRDHVGYLPCLRDVGISGGVPAIPFKDESAPHTRQLLKVVNTQSFSHVWLRALVSYSNLSTANARMPKHGADSMSTSYKKPRTQPTNMRTLNTHRPTNPVHTPTPANPTKPCYPKP